MMAKSSDAKAGSDALAALDGSGQQAAAAADELRMQARNALWVCVMSLGLAMLALIVSLPYGNPNAPPLYEIIGFVGIFAVLPALGLAGAVSMLRRRNYWLAVVGSWCLVIPILGPCFGLSILIGIWSLMCLRKPEVRALFRP